MPSEQTRQKSEVRPIEHESPDYHRAAQSYRVQWGKRHTLPKRNIYGVYSPEGNLVAVFELVRITAMKWTWRIGAVVVLAMVFVVYSTFASGTTGASPGIIWALRGVLVACTVVLGTKLATIAKYGVGLPSGPTHIVQKLAAVTEVDRGETTGGYRMRYLVEAIAHTPGFPCRFLVHARTPKHYKAYLAIKRRSDATTNIKVSVLKPSLWRRWRARGEQRHTSASVANNAARPVA